MVQSSSNMQRRTMKLLTSMPPRSLKHLLSDMEAEIENFTELHDDVQISDQEKTTDLSDMTKFYESYNAKLRSVGLYSLCLFSLMLCYACMFIPPFQDKEQSEILAILLEYSGQRASYVYQVNAVAIEWKINDNITWTSETTTRAYYKRNLMRLNKLQDMVTHGDEKKGLRGTNELPEWMELLKYKIANNVICRIYRADGSCLSNRNYYKQFGVTKG
jgi:hypothetical protein